MSRESTKVSVSAEDLAGLRELSLKAGTLENWSGIAVEWCQHASEQLKALQAEDERLRGLLSQVLSIAAEAREHWDADRDMKVGKLLIALSGRLPGYRTDIDAIVAAAGAGSSAQNDHLKMTSG